MIPDFCFREFILGLEHLPSILEVLGLIPIIVKKKKEEEEENSHLTLTIRQRGDESSRRRQENSRGCIFHAEDKWKRSRAVGRETQRTGYIFKDQKYSYRM